MGRASQCKRQSFSSSLGIAPPAPSTTGEVSVSASPSAGRAFVLLLWPNMSHAAGGFPPLPLAPSFPVAWSLDRAICECLCHLSRAQCADLPGRLPCGAQTIPESRRKIESGVRFVQPSPDDNISPIPRLAPVMSRIFEACIVQIRSEICPYHGLLMACFDRSHGGSCNSRGRRRPSVQNRVVEPDLSVSRQVDPAGFGPHKTIRMFELGENGGRGTARTAHEQLAGGKRRGLGTELNMLFPCVPSLKLAEDKRVSDRLDSSLPISGAPFQLGRCQSSRAVMSVEANTTGNVAIEILAALLQQHIPGDPLFHGDAQCLRSLVNGNTDNRMAPGSV